MYVQNFHILEDDLLQSEFRTQFRLPYNAFHELAEKVSLDDQFVWWCGPKYHNKSISPVMLLLLGFLSYLGHEWINHFSVAPAVAKQRPFPCR